MDNQEFMTGMCGGVPIFGYPADTAREGEISDVWSASVTYGVGAYCIYNNKLWKCKVQNSGQVPSENSYWTNVNLASEINKNTSDISTLNSTLTGEVYDTGWDLVLDRNELKKNSKVVFINVICRRENGIPDYNYSFLGVPQGFRPSKTTLVPLVLIAESWTDVKYTIAEIAPSGEVKVLYSVDTSGYTQARLCGTWIID